MLASPLSREQILALTPDELVNKLWDKRIRNDVERALVGGLGKSETYGLSLRPEVREALVRGLQHPSPKVRWWCLQLIDHNGDIDCLRHVPPLLHDPVPRVRKQALHALTCEACKADEDLVRAGRRFLEQSG